jgi:hypothetical protein
MSKIITHSFFLEKIGQLGIISFIALTIDPPFAMQIPMLLMATIANLNLLLKAGLGNLYVRDKFDTVLVLYCTKFYINYYVYELYELYETVLTVLISQPWLKVLQLRKYSNLSWGKISLIQDHREADSHSYSIMSHVIHNSHVLHCK